LLAYVDVTFGEINGGAFFDHQDAATSVLSAAIEAAWQRLGNRPPQVMRCFLDLLGPYSRLGCLVSEVFEEKHGGEADLCTRSGAFTDYLDEVLGGGEDIEEDSGVPGMSSLCRAYWDRAAKSAARRALKAFRDDAKKLRRLVAQCEGGVRPGPRRGQTPGRD
jgi:hypothetical protein